MGHILMIYGRNKIMKNYLSLGGGGIPSDMVLGLLELAETSEVAENFITGASSIYQLGFWTSAGHSSTAEGLQDLWSIPKLLLDGNLKSQTIISYIIYWKFWELCIKKKVGRNHSPPLPVRNRVKWLCCMKIIYYDG